MNFRGILFSIVFFFSLLSLPAQSDTMYYYVKEGNRCDKEFADSYRKTWLVDVAYQRYSYEDYSLEDSTLKSRGYYLHNKFSHKTGSYTEYYKNGKRKATGSYFSDGKKIEGEKVNTWFYWYETGSIELEKLYGLDTSTNSFKDYIISFWDTAGNKNVIDGNGNYSFKEKYSLSPNSSEEITFSGRVKYGQLDGMWKGFSADGTLLYEETYNQDGLVEGKRYGRYRESYTYNKVKTMPEFEGGETGLINFLKKNIRYPQKERSEDTQGKVMIRFVIDANGKVKDAKVINSVSPGLDQEALRVVNMLENIKPGLVRGQPASGYYYLPVVFRLQ